jgi:hypothetical protein
MNSQLTGGRFIDASGIGGPLANGCADPLPRIDYPSVFLWPHLPRREEALQQVLLDTPLTAQRIADSVGRQIAMSLAGLGQPLAGSFEVGQAHSASLVDVVEIRREIWPGANG